MPLPAPVTTATSIFWIAAGRQMSAPGGSIMQDQFRAGNAPSNGRVVTFGTSILAAGSAVALVLMSGCHSTPSASGFVSSRADRAVEVRLQRPDAMAPLQPFDEGFYVQPPDAAAP
jgi:hypothetical protein